MITRDILRNYIKTLKPNTRIRRRYLRRKLNLKVSEGTITRALGELATEGLLRKSDRMVGRNSEWIVLKARYYNSVDY